MAREDGQKCGRGTLPRLRLSAQNVVVLALPKVAVTQFGEQIRAAAALWQTCLILSALMMLSGICYWAVRICKVSGTVINHSRLRDHPQWGALPTNRYCARNVWSISSPAEGLLLIVACKVTAVNWRRVPRLGNDYGLYYGNDVTTFVINKPVSYEDLEYKPNVLK